MRRLDVANNIFVRLEKLNARWREGMSGEHAWHRLDRLSVRLEEWRREADEAVRNYEGVSLAGELSECSSSSSSSVAKGASEDSLNGSEDFEAVSDGASRRLARGQKRRSMPEAQDVRGYHSHGSEKDGAESSRDARPWRRRRKDSGGSMHRSGRDIQSDGDNVQGVARKRPRPKSSRRTDESRQHQVRSKRRVSRGTQDGEDMRGADSFSITQEGRGDRYLSGLDDGMAADTGNDVEGSRYMTRPLSPSSGSHASEDDRWLGPMRHGEGRRQERDFRQSRASAGPSGGISRADIGSNGTRRSQMRAGGGVRAQGTRDPTPSDTQRAVGTGSRGRGGRRKSKWMERALFQQRLAEQEARGGALRNHEQPAVATARTGTDQLAGEEVKLSEGGELGAQQGSRAKTVRLNNLVGDLLSKPQRSGVLEFKTMRAVSQLEELLLSDSTLPRCQDAMVPSEILNKSRVGTVFA